MGTTLKLLPVCECGYVIRDLELDSIEVLCGWKYIVPFKPSRCPNCNQFIDSMIVDMNMLKAFGTRKRDEYNG